MLEKIPSLEDKQRSHIYDTLSRMTYIQRGIMSTFPGSKIKTLDTRMPRAYIPIKQIKTRESTPKDIVSLK